MRIAPKLTALLAALLPFAGCSEVPGPIAIDAMGGIAVLMYVDRDGDGRIDEEFDTPAGGLGIALVSSAGQVVETATVPATGEWRFGPLPVGRYRVTVPASALGDSLLFTSDQWIDVVAGDTTSAQVGVGYPTVTAAQLASLPAGRIVAIRGIALNAVGGFSDSLVHIVDGGIVVRTVVLSSSGPLAVGDSARILGRVGVSLGRRALVGALAFSLRAGPPPAPVVLTAAQAASANGGTADGALVRVAGARVLSVTDLPGGGERVRISDASGVVDIVIDREVEVLSADPLMPGVDISVTGVLVPIAAEGVWTLRPRASADVAVSVPAVTIAAAKALPLGSVVSMTGVALNGVAGFSDHSLHFTDATGSMRALDLNTTFIFPGNQVRVSGVVAVREGRVVITPATVTVLGPGVLPAPALVNTGVAANANGGVLDAALVEVRNALVTSVDPGSGEASLVVNDGTGAVGVQIDGSTGIASNVLPLNARANIVGVLVPTGTGNWVLKPRSPADVTPL